MSKKLTFILLFFILFVINIYGQQSLYTRGYTMSGSNAYQTVNKNLFLTPVASADPDLVKHFFTLLKLSYKIKSMFAGIETPTSTPVISDSLRLWKKKFTKGIDVHVVIIRPDDTIYRPCILLTPGASADFDNNYTNLYIGAADLAMHGYVVAFYENPVTKTFISNNSLANTMAVLASDAYVNSHAEFNGLDEVFKNEVMPCYIGWQVSLALQQYIDKNASGFNIDNNWLFAAGHSAGAIYSLQLAYAEKDFNFIHDYYSAYKPDNKYCIDTSEIKRTIKAVASIDGELREDDSIVPGLFGKMITKNDSVIPALFLHGVNDNTVSIINTKHGAPLYYSDNGPVILSKELTDVAHTKFQTIVDCESGHMFGTLFNDLTFADSSGVLTPNYSLYSQQDNGGFIANATLPEPALTDLYINSSYVQTNKNNFYKAYAYISQMEDAIFYMSKFFSERMNHFSSLNSYIRYTSSVSEYRNQSSTKFLTELDTAKCLGLNLPTFVKSNSVISLKFPFHIYPNPTNMEFTIEANNAESNYNVSMYNMIGEIVYSQNNIAKGNNVVKINTSTLANGMYQLVINNNESKINKSIVVQH